MSATEPSAAEHTAEDVEALAVRLMGWVRSDDPLTIGEAYMQGKTPVLFAFKDGTGYGVSRSGRRTGRWDPFSDPRDDVQVLERVREVWGTSANWTRFVLAFSRPLLAEVKSHDFAPHVAFSIVLGGLRVGSFARAALAVLREMEEG